MTGEEPIFERRVLIRWSVAAVAAFALAVFFMAQPAGDAPDPIGPTVESRSALGYAGIADILERIGTPVVHTRSRARERLGDGGVLVIAEPHIAQQDTAIALKLLRVDAALLILPKWEGVECKGHPGWIERADLTPFPTVQAALDLVDMRGRIKRGPAPRQWGRNIIGVNPVIAAPMQTITSKRLTPIVADGDRILVGELKRGGKRVFVLADPDVLSNHGLENPINAAFAAALIAELRGGDGPVVFDEALNGATGSGPNLLGHLFKPPLLPGSLLVIAAAMLLLWAAMPRFGAPDAPAPALESGKRGLIDNIASLMGFAGRRPMIVGRFVDATIQEVARLLHAPRGLTGGALTDWLLRVGRARGVEIDCAAAFERARAIAAGGAADPATLVSLARDITLWKQEMIDGSGRNQKPR
jgi:hypothetical protein